MTGKDIIIPMTEAELSLALKVGGEHFIQRTVIAKSDNHGLTKAPVDHNVIGIISELAVAKAFGFRYDPSESQHKNPDMAGTLVQVRATNYKTGSMIIRPADSTDHYYILAITKNWNNIRLVGWMKGEDMRQERWLKDPSKNGRPNAWFVPQDALHPFPLPAEALAPQS